MVAGRGIHRVRMAFIASALVAAVVVTGSPLGAAPGSVRAVDDEVHLNEVQVIGSHNSYKRMVSPKEQEVRRSFIGEGADLLEYQHEPLPVQFQSQKVRQIELDVFLDSAGGLYRDPLLREAAGVGPYDPAMDEPGIKVLHIQDVDYATTCLTLISCLEAVDGWSDANPSHLPIMILLELKDTPLDFGGINFTDPEPWTAPAMDTLDEEIRSVMEPGEMITPDDIRGARPTLEEAVLTDGWPTLGESRGKVLFAMDNGGGYRRDYLSGHPTLEDRVVFTNASPGSPDAAFVKRNDPMDASIPGLVRDGYVVRTRADADTREARDENTGPRDAALASGAQWVSTDYPVPGIAFGFTTDYVAEIPGGTVARCNPINGPPACVSAELDTIFTPIAPPPPPPPPTPTTPPVTAPTGPTATTPGVPVTVPGAVAPAEGAAPVAGEPTFTG